MYEKIYKKSFIGVKKCNNCDFAFLATIKIAIFATATTIL